MSAPDPALISHVRSASRALVREFGFLDHTLAGSDLSPSAVHAVVETGLAGSITASDLTTLLRLDKSTLSRLLASLIRRGEMSEIPDTADQRRKILKLTRMGRKTFDAINVYAETQVRDALGRLTATERRLVAGGIDTYARALSGAAVGHTFSIDTGYASGLIGRIIEMHVGHYSHHAGFGAAFEAKLAADLSAFVMRLDTPCNEVWTLRRAGEIEGSIAIDGEDLDDGHAHLRWFIVEESLRGAGAGARLLTSALAFCDDSGFETIDLWTLKGLDAARALYEANGFELIDEYEGNQWGETVTEQRFRRTR